MKSKSARRSVRPDKTSRRPSQRLGGEQPKQYEGARPVLREMLQNLGVWCGQSAAENGLQNDGGGSVRPKSEIKP
jgi:hypothetical protein